MNSMVDLMNLPDIPAGATLRRTFVDPHPERLIYRRIFWPFVTFSRFTDLSDEEGQLFLRLLNLNSRKLASVWSHLDRFKKGQAEAEAGVREAQAQRPDVTYVDQSQLLFSEFDEFVVQVKSTLDHLAHVPVPIFGASVWNMRTFGDRGEVLKKALIRAVSVKKYGTGIDVVVAHLFNAAVQKRWLEATIDARDRITHYQRGGIPVEAFEVVVVGDDVRLPEWAPGQTIEQFMEVIWSALVRYVEDFLALFLALRLKPGTVFALKSVEGLTPETPWLAMPTQVADVVALDVLRSPPYVRQGRTSAPDGSGAEQDGGV